MGYAVAPVPEDEAERLAELHRYGVLDSEAERAFDRITAITARIFQTPICLVSLVDSHRQWFKSCVGIEARETSRDVAFCAHALLHKTPMVIRDTKEDARFANHPFVLGPPFVRFYAGAPLATPSGHNLGTLCVVDTRPRDIDDEKLAILEELAAMVVDELELRLVSRSLEMQGEVLRNVFDSVGDGIVVADGSGRFEIFNKAAKRILGVGATEALPDRWVERYGVFETDEKTPYAAGELPLARAMRGEATDQVELFIRNPNRTEGAFISVTGRPMRDSDGRGRGGVVTFTDVTELRRARAELAMLATTDPLTALPNKRAFSERLDLLVAEGGRGRKFAVILADVDHFKSVNDTHGHAVGDEVLIAVGRALRARLRKTDLVARVGGEEFCTLLVDVDVDAALRIAEELRAAIETIDTPLHVTSSFGVSVFGGATTTAAAMMKAADDALYRAKREGRNRVVRAA